MQVAIGTGVPAVTSFADGVSVTTFDGETETTEAWDFEAAGSAPAASIPSTSMDPLGLQSGSGLVIAFGSLTLLSALAIAVVRVQRSRASR